MGIFYRLFGKVKQNATEQIDAKCNSNQNAVREVVTDCRLWKCPKCSELLEKGALGTSG
jgi:hypothetical protein